MNGAGAVLFILLFMALASIIGGLYWRFRNLQLLHAERMAAMEKGLTIPVWQPYKPWSSRVYLLRGLMWTFGGAALALALYSIAAASQRPEPMAWTIREAKSLSVEDGISMDEARKIVEQDRANRLQGPPPAIALLGLIPVGIGLAYLLYFFTDNSRKSMEEESVAPLMQR